MESIRHFPFIDSSPNSTSSSSTECTYTHEEKWHYLQLVAISVLYYTVQRRLDRVSGLTKFRSELLVHITLTSYTNRERPAPLASYVNNATQQKTPGFKPTFFQASCNIIYINCTRFIDDLFLLEIVDVVPQSGVRMFRNSHYICRREDASRPKLHYCLFSLLFM